MKTALLIGILLMCTLPLSYSQNSTAQSSDLSKAFENPDPKIELERLKFKKSNLELRLNELNQAQTKDSLEIARVEGLIKYVNRKIETLEKYIQSEEYAQQNGKPEQGTMTDEEYDVKLSTWKNQLKDSTANKVDQGIKTTLTREEFNRLPKERQDKILSMPERYTILD